MDFNFTGEVYKITIYKLKLYFIFDWMDSDILSGGFQISLEGFRYLSRRGLIPLEGFKYPYWGFNIPLEGFRSFLGVYKLSGRISESLQWNFKSPERISTSLQ